MMNEKTKVRTSPMTESEMKKVILSDDPYIKENVYIEMNDLINNDFEQLMDLMSSKITGTELLMDINYRIVGLHDEYTMIVEVTGDISECVAVSDYEKLEKLINEFYIKLDEAKDAKKQIHEFIEDCLDINLSEYSEKVENDESFCYGINGKELLELAESEGIEK